MINVSRKYSGGVFNGLFGNPVKEAEVTEQYRTYLRGLMLSHPEQCNWLREQLQGGEYLYCAGCKIGSPTCHARIIEQELKKPVDSGK